MSAAERRSTIALLPIVSGLSLAFTVTAVDPLILSLNMPQISRALDVPPDAVGFLGGAATLVVAAAVLAVGSLGDAFGLKRLLMLGLVGDIAVNLLSALSPGYVFLLVMRLLDGLALAAMLGVSLALLKASVPAERRPAAIGIFMAIEMVLCGVTPAAGGWLVEALGWRWLFLVAPLLSLVALGLTARYVTEPPVLQRRGVDVVGVSLVGLALLTLVHGIAEAENGIIRIEAWLPLVISAIAGVLFVFHERRTPEPVLELSLFRSGAFTVAALSSLTLNFAVAGFSFVLGQFGSVILSLPPRTIGLLFLPGTLLIAGAVILAGRLIEKYAPRPVLITGLLLLVASGLLMAATAETTMALWILVLATWLANLGSLVASASVAETILSHAPSGKSGAVASVQPAFGMTGYALGPAVYLLLLNVFFQRQWLNDADARGMSATQAEQAVDATRSAMARSPGTAGYDPNLLRQSGLDLGLDLTNGLRLTMLVTSLLPLALAVAAYVLMPRRSRTAPQDPPE
ncbi:arabinose ABC transporter permease [Streptomyces globosus]|uniref:Arabinose ABC transporter permease n=1 Tax=Streptomyces globosus TaxID=68209 RepID=A0A344U744_9ACTN|nr:MULTISPECIES: MFS transporter [Streptomyces]AXE26715.1 arabinose ABC transporter permease [Streptomyces globosus]